MTEVGGRISGLTSEETKLAVSLAPEKKENVSDSRVDFRLK